MNPKPRNPFPRQQRAHVSASPADPAHTVSSLFPLHWQELPWIQKLIEYPAPSQQALQASEVAICDAHTVEPPLSGMFPHVHLSSLIELESSNPAFLQQVEHSPLKERLIASVIRAHTSTSM
jgi:hypothetical protein